MLTIPHVVLGSVKLTGTERGIELEFQTHISHEQYLAGEAPPTHLFVLSEIDLLRLMSDVTRAREEHRMELEAKWEQGRQSQQAKTDQD